MTALRPNHNKNSNPSPQRIENNHPTLDPSQRPPRAHQIQTHTTDTPVPRQNQARNNQPATTAPNTANQPTATTTTPTTGDHYNSTHNAMMHNHQRRKTRQTSRPQASETTPRQTTQPTTHHQARTQRQRNQQNNQIAQFETALRLQVEHRNIHTNTPQNNTTQPGQPEATQQPTTTHHTRQTTIEDPNQQLLENAGWGLTSEQTPQDNICRLYFINVNGLGTSADTRKASKIFQATLGARISILAMAETNTNWNKRQTHHATTTDA
jgi:hypothetical protein